MVNLAGSSTPRRKVRHPARGRLIAAVVLVLVGSFLPWLYVSDIAKSGASGPGLWTFYGGMIGLAALLLPWQRVGGIHALMMAGICIGIPAWQVAHVVGLVGFSGWNPGPGLVMVAFAGVLAAVSGWQLVRDPLPTA